MIISGDVIAVESRWVADGSRIVTDAVVATSTGPVTVSQLGGTVGDLTMRTFVFGGDAGPPMLAVGMRVAVDTHEAPDLTARMHHVVDSVRVLALPPGFVRTGKTKGGHYLYWESGCVFVSVAAEGTKDINGDVEFTLVEQSIAEWNERVAACSYMTIVNEGPVADTETYGRDNINLIKFRDASWCRPAVGDDPPRCHAMSAAGLTTATYVDSTTNERDGAIVDADIELNSVTFDIGNDGMTLGTFGCIADLRNTLTHELGHLLGLEHTCRTATDPERVDDQGAAVPLCTMATTSGITEATMFNYQECGETKKASLSPDDVDAICSVYATTADPGTCVAVTVDGGCCGVSEHPTSALLGAAWVALVLRRRRRAR